MIPVTRYSTKSVFWQEAIEAKRIKVVSSFFIVLFYLRPIPRRNYIRKGVDKRCFCLRKVANAELNRISNSAVFCGELQELI